MKIERNGVEIELTLQEVQQAYDIYLHDCKVLDAKSQYEDWIEYEGFEKNVEKDMEDFVHMYGFHPDAASDPGSEHYLLEKFVSKFDEKFDCGRAENDIWHEAITEVMGEIFLAHTASRAEKKYEVTYEETLAGKFFVLAANEDQARQVWQEQYRAGEIDQQAMKVINSGISSVREVF